MNLSLLLRGLCALVLMLWIANTARAVMPDEMLPDAALEARAQALGLQLRCLVCQNQSLEDSGAPLARDLRIIVRERLTAGDSDEEVVAYLVRRYGNFVLLKPPLQPDTYMLWFGPAMLAAVAGFIAFAYFRRRQSLPPEQVLPLSQAERQDLAALTKES